MSSAPYRPRKAAEACGSSPPWQLLGERNRAQREKWSGSKSRSMVRRPRQDLWPQLRIQPGHALRPLDCGEPTRKRMCCTPGGGMPEAPLSHAREGRIRCESAVIRREAHRHTSYIPSRRCGHPVSGMDVGTGDGHRDDFAPSDRPQRRRQASRGVGLGGSNFARRSRPPELTSLRSHERAGPGVSPSARRDCATTRRACRAQARSGRTPSPFTLALQR